MDHAWPMKRNRDGIKWVERADRELVCALANRCQTLAGFRSDTFDDGDWQLILKWAEDQPPVGTLRGQLAVARILQKVGRYYQSASAIELVGIREGSENPLQTDNRLVVEA